METTVTKSDVVSHHMKLYKNYQEFDWAILDIDFAAEVDNSRQKYYYY